MTQLLGLEWFRIFAVIVFMIGGAVLVMGGTSLVRERRLLGRRLRAPQVTDAPVRSDPAHKILLEDNFLSRFEDFVTPTKEQDLVVIRQRLIRAGYRLPSAVRVFYAAKAALSLGFSVVAAILLAIFGATLPFPAMLAAVIVPALLGFLLPSFWIERQTQRRREEAELGFPDVLDMLLVCVEAGNSLDQACRRVAKEIAGVQQVLAEEFGIINDELRAGKQRSQVFADFADRLNVPDLRAFATILKHSEEFGVSIGDTLRVYASEMRYKRVMRAEEKANLMPVKIAMGSILFTVPPTMLVMAAPSLIMMLRAFAGLAAGGH
jgi:tight adherence protein C